MTLRDPIHRECATFEPHERCPECRPSKIRALREGEIMGLYMDFDRHADKAWTSAEYLLRFGAAVSLATAVTNRMTEE